MKEKDNEIKKENDKKFKFDINDKLTRFIMIGATVLAIVILVVYFWPIAFSKASEKETLEKSLTEMAEKFYSEFYFEQVKDTALKENTEVADFLNKYTETGVKINLENLERYNGGEFKDDVATFKNSEKNQECDKKNTMAIIYPKSPYGKTDFTVEPALDCGFEE